MKAKTDLPNMALLYRAPLILFCLLIPACNPSSELETPSQAEGSVPEQQVGLPNPASVFCEEQGYVLEIRTAADGSQSGFCIFPTGGECDEWAFYRGECGPSISEATPSTQVSPNLDIKPQKISNPSGILLSTPYQAGLTLYSTGGEIIEEWKTEYPAPAKGLLTGPVKDRSSVPGLIYVGSTEIGPAIQFNQAGTTSILLEIDPGIQLTGIVGAPAMPVFVFSTIEPKDDGATLESKLSVGNSSSSAPETPVLVYTSDEAKITVPVALGMENGLLKGMWYTFSPWGIGGDIFVDPRSGLRYLDLDTQSDFEVLPENQRFSALSMDQTWAAGSSNSPNSPMTLTQIETGVIISYPLLPDGERGAVHAQISPGNCYVAWIEGKGIEWDGNLETTLRVGDFSGEIIAEFRDSILANAAGFDDGVSLIPLGWIDDQTLLVGVDAAGKEDIPGILKVDILSGEIQMLAEGIFSGFAYPG